MRHLLRAFVVVAVAAALVAAAALVEDNAGEEHIVSADDLVLGLTDDETVSDTGASTPEDVAAPSLDIAGDRVSYVPKQLLVRFADDVAPKRRRLVRERFDLELIKKLQTDGLELVRVPPTESVHDARRRVGSAEEVAYSEPNFLYTATSTPSDPYFTSLWGLENSGRTGIQDADIDAATAWDETTGSDRVTVAVVDSGVAYNHPDLSGNVWTNVSESGGRQGVDDDGNGFVDDVRGWDWVGDDASPIDGTGHGSHVAGTIGATGDNGEGITGVNWDVSLMSLRVLASNGRGSTSDVAMAFQYAARNGARVVNASLGGAGRSQVLMDVMNAAPQTLFVVAAGNSSQNNDVTPSYPCNYNLPNVICVAATSSTDELASFSNYGGSSVHLAAPGTRILSTVPDFDEPFVEDFEGPLADRWSVGSGWGKVAGDAGFYISESPSGTYADSAESTISSASPINLTRYSECALTFQLRLESHVPNDVLHVESSRDGYSWTTLSTWSGSTQGKWTGAVTDLSKVAGDEIRLRLRFVSDASLTQNGADVDDLTLRCVTPTYTTTTYAYYSGTSMATPHVAGAAALLWSAAPTAQAADIKSALLSGVDAVPVLSTTTVSGGRLNLAGSIEAIAPNVAPPAASPSASAAAPPSGSPTPTPAESASPEPTTDPSPTPEPKERAISAALGLKRHLVARGTVTGDPSCREDRVVKIIRRGRTVGRGRTDDTGAFRIRLPDKPGSYVAVTRATSTCASVRSEAERHRH